MLSIKTITAKNAGQYYTHDNYYSRSEGVWQVKTAEDLGLTGEFEKEAFDNLIHGKAPEGTVLVSYEPRYVNGRLQEPRAVIDNTLGAPKSASVLSEVLGDKRVGTAHDAAVTKTVTFMEKHCSQARITYNGITEKVHTGNLIVAKFTHTTSRELDPHLHTHAVVMNITKRPDGQYRALSNEKFFEHKMLLGLVYRSELAANLKELGYSIRTDDKGLFEIEGVDQKLIDHFSRRSKQIEQKFRELKESGQYKNADDQKLREIACLGSRVAKRDVDLEQVRESWMERVKEQGFTRDGILEATRMAAEKARDIERIRAGPRESPSDYIRKAARIVTEQESVFFKEDILKTSGKLTLGKYRISDLEKGFHEMVKKKEIVTLDTKKGVYTTKEILLKEQEIPKIIRRYSYEPIASREHAKKDLKDFEWLQQQRKPDFKYTEGQMAAAEHVLTSRTIALVQGDAGTGKTAFIHAVKIIAGMHNYEVRGLAFTGKAGEELQKASGIRSQTIHSFLSGKIEMGPKQLWVVDEASMVGSKQMYDLLKAAEQVKAGVAMIGDTKQLQSLPAGRMFQKLQEMGFKTVEMKETLRQQDQGYKDVVKDVTERRIDDAFEKLLKQDRIHENKDPEALKDQIVHDYTDSVDYRATIIVTALNRDRSELNQKIREGLKSEGKLKGNELTFTTRLSKGLNPSERHFAQSYQANDIITINKSGIGIKVGAEARVVNVNPGNHTITVQTSKGEREIDLNRHGEKLSVYQEKGTPVMKGDKIVFLKNDRDLNIQNGLTGTVKAINERGNMTVKLDAGREIGFNLQERYNYIDHGYAVTDYKSQGQTANAVLYHAETLQQAKSTYNSFYVAITRGKQEVKIYTDSVETLKEQVKHEQVKSSTLDYTKEQPDKQPELDKADEDKESTAKDSMTKDSRVELPQEDRSRSRDDDDGGREIEM